MLKERKITILASPLMRFLAPLPVKQIISMARMTVVRPGRNQFSTAIRTIQICHVPELLQRKFWIAFCKYSLLGLGIKLSGLRLKLHCIRYSDLLLVHKGLRKPLSYRYFRIIFTPYIHTLITTIKQKQNEKKNVRFQNGGHKSNVCFVKRVT